MKRIGAYNGAYLNNRATIPPMAKPVPTKTLDQIATLMTQHPQGLGLEALDKALHSKVARRTLQRHLATLVAQGRLVVQGEGRALKYLCAPYLSAPHVTPQVTQPMHFVAQPPTANYGDGPALSTQGQQIRAYIHQPRQRRKPVSYNLAFLEAYEPNHTAYLPPALCAQLQTLGRASVEPHAAAGTFARDILNRLLIDLSWASSHLEGNTYSRLDTERLIELGQAAEGKNALETQMILNHKAAIEFLVGDPHVAVNTDTVIALHALLSDGLLHDATAGGRVRRRAVEISGSVYRPLALPQQLEELLGIAMQMAAEIADPFEQAFFLMVHLPYLQPFEDVNKRVSRLAANIPFVQHNLSPLSFIDVPTQSYIDGMLGVYELTRIELLRDVFVWAYARSCQQYVAVHQELVPPDTFRLRYRAQLGTAIKTLVQQRLPLKDTALKRVTPATVAPADRARFVELLRTEFDSLHAGNAIRFGVRPLELSAWQAKYQRKP